MIFILWLYYIFALVFFSGATLFADATKKKNDSNVSTAHPSQEKEGFVWGSTRDAIIFPTAPSTLRIKLSNRKCENKENKENIPETPMRPPRRMVKIVNLTDDMEEDEPLIRKRQSGGANEMLWSDEDDEALNRALAKHKDASF